MSKCRSGFGESSLCKCILCKADRIAILERELAEVRKNHQWEMGSRAVCLTEIDKLKRELAAVSAERDALLEGKWAGPWEQVGHEWHRSNSRGLVAEASLLRPTAHRADVRWFWEVRGGDDAICATADEAKAAADAALVRAGWYLAPTPPTGTPGDGTR